MKPVHYLLIGALAVPIVVLALMHEPLNTQVDLRSEEANVRVSIVRVSSWDHLLFQANPTVNPNIENMSIVRPDGQIPGDRLGTVTISAWGKVYTLPPDMVRDCYSPRKDSSGWKIRTEKEGVYIGTMMGTDVGKTLIWWEIGRDLKARRWVFPMTRRRDLSSLPKSTDVPVETQPLLSFDE